MFGFSFGFVSRTPRYHYLENDDVAFFKKQNW